jgi:hypothetical protein
MLKQGQIGGYAQHADTVTEQWPGTLVSSGDATEITLDWFYLPENPHIQTCFFTAGGSGHDVPTVEAEALRDACIFGDHIQSNFESTEMAWLFLQQYRFDRSGNVICDPLYDDPGEVDTWCELITSTHAPTGSDMITILQKQKNAWRRGIK